jgi:hypothetical protein
MATTHEHSQAHIPSGSDDASGSKEKDHTLVVQGAILGGIVVLLLIASFFDVI